MRKSPRKVLPIPHNQTVTSPEENDGSQRFTGMSNTICRIENGLNDKVDTTSAE